MAITRFVIDGYGQVELNNCAFRRDGRIEAQCKPNTTDFSVDKLENGMLLAIDQVAREVKYPTANNSNELIALNYTSEHLYDERAQGLNNFATSGTDDFLPRLGYLAVGDKFTTNCVNYDTTEYATESALTSALAAIASVAMYGKVSTKGAITLTSTAPSAGVKLNVVKQTTMPDGTFGVKFQVARV